MKVDFTDKEMIAYKELLDRKEKREAIFGKEMFVGK